ncbi:hypothetical protein GCM10025868_08850 [Angustibacter aerolatus]|uniref:Uncharacterized protein n=1 Tax=Angustibacter aerolatus TaxID=1162965 RepID=A0ABQ6JBS8_9ACTN|nr:hypothetical protein GCM10025868_08850 [Angustibacter aerolatus]
MRVPVSTPAGTRMVRLRRLRTRPSPEHCTQGWAMTVPNPWQVVHGRVVMTLPRKERCTCSICPRPLQTSQRRVPVPGWAPSPPQVGQPTAVSTAISRSVPNTASRRSTCTRMSAS